MVSTLKKWQEKEFNEFIKAKKSGVIEFSAPWCGACKLIEPILNEVAKDFPEISLAQIDVSSNPKLAAKMGVMSIPNILFFSKGKVADQSIGMTNKTVLENKIKKILK